MRTVADVPGRPERFRVVAEGSTRRGDRQRCSVGVNDDDVSDPVRILSRVLAGAVPLVVASLAALTWWLTGRTLRPVERMRRELADITAGHRGRRVAEPGTGDEVDRLARTMNETLDRLDAAITRQTALRRRCVARAAQPPDAHPHRARGRPGDAWEPPGDRAQRAAGRRVAPAPRRRPAPVGAQRRSGAPRCGSNGSTSTTSS